MLRRTFHWCHHFCTAGWDVEFTVTFTKRRLRRHLLRGALLAVPLALLSYGALQRSQGAPHEFAPSKCSGCHSAVPRPGDAGDPRFVDRIDALCRGCHGDLELVSHVVNVAPTVSVPGDLPLDADGNLTCATCHDPHRPYADPKTGERTWFLRVGVVGRGRCQACHAAELSSSGEPTRRPAMDRAHGFSGYTVVDEEAAVDGLSAACLDCHDNPEARERTAPGAGVWRHGSDVGLSHRLGMDYGRAAFRGSELRSMDAVEEVLPLFDGRVGCCTCHDPYRPGGGIALRVGTGRDYAALCMTCHLH